MHPHYARPHTIMKAKPTQGETGSTVPSSTFHEKIQEQYGIEKEIQDFVTSISSGNILESVENALKTPNFFEFLYSSASNLSFLILQASLRSTALAIDDGAARLVLDALVTEQADTAILSKHE